MAKRIGFISLGCAKNLVNSEQMMCLLSEAGYEVTGDTAGADAVVVNTCGFIDSAKSEAIDTILGLAGDKSSSGKIIVTGCLAERYKDEILTEMPEVDAVAGVGSFFDIVDVVGRTLSGERFSCYGPLDRPEPETGRILTTSPVWEYIKIAEGCDNRCAYCVIPDLRGPFRSRRMEDIIEEAETLASSGIRELIVVAQDITRYGTDLYGKKSLSELLRRLCRIEGFEWIRLHYLYPDEIDDELIDVIAGEKKILKYLDIPIQHIDDGILARMNRRGSGGEIRTLFRKLRERIPGLVLRTSLIAGLPGEGEAEFEELCSFLREVKIERAGVFPYSPEEGTPAAVMERPDEETAQKRAELIMELQADIMDDFNRSRIESTARVLVEGYNGEYWYGRSFAESPDIDGHILFSAEDGLDLDGFVTVKITGMVDGEPLGVLSE